MRDFSLLLKYKICYLQQSSLIDKYLYGKYTKKEFEIKTCNEILYELSGYGFISIFGFNTSSFRDALYNYLLLVPNSELLQCKWAKENNLNYSKKNWEKEILAAQIEKFQPDVIYTGNYFLFTKELKKYLPKVKLYALWNASPMQEGIDLSHFDIGISFNKVYHKNLQERGVKNIEYNSFYIDPKIKTRLDRMNLKQDIDIAFVGRYSQMFKDRNKFLYDIYKEFKNNYSIQYYLLTNSRLKGLVPMLPWNLLRVYNKPVFLEDMFKVFNRSKIVLNTHSNITGEYKGNMRVYEALASGSFMLSDYGVYPEYLEDGKDFVTYRNNKDMVEKIEYYLKHDEERKEIALNGYNKISKYYSTDIGSQNLEKIFEKYL
jgi:glycosyltransferase involved in cell wall biosynthesis